MNIFTSKTLYFFLLLFLIGFSLYAGKVLLVFFIPFLLAYLMARILGPIKNLLHKKLRLPVQLATLIAMALVITVLGTALYALGSIVISQLRDLADNLPALGNSIYDSVVGAFSHVESWIDLTPAFFDDVFSQMMDALVNGIGEMTKGAGKEVLGVIAFIPNMLFYILIMLIATYYLSNDLDRLRKSWKAFSKRSEFFDRIRETFQNDIVFAIVAYLRAQGILMLITFAILSVGLFLSGYRYFLLIALGTAVLDALPIFGTGTVFAPWILIELLNGHYPAALALGALYLVASVTRQLLQPKILSTQIGLNPFLTLVSIYIGIRLFGVWGILIGPILMILITSIVKVLKNTNIRIELK